MNQTVKTTPFETESGILYKKRCKLERYDVRYEIWKVHGFFSECIIFANEDVSVLDDKKLEQLVRNSVRINEGSAITISRSTELTFIIFNIV